MSYGNQFPPKKLKSGTELPLMNLKGKPYLQVAHRLVWFREEHPTATIMTEFLKLTETGATCKATIGLARAEGGGHSIVATAHKSETAEGFADFVEKSETGAIGRALALLGYGTQFEPDLDEGDRLADSPIAVAAKPKTPAKAPSVPVAASDDEIGQSPPGKVLGTITGTFKASSPVPEAPPSDRGELNRMIAAQAAALVAKRKKTPAELKEWIKGSYGVEKKEELTDSQAADLYGKLRDVFN